MTALAVFARLVDMTDNTVIASTRNLPRGSIARVLDKPGRRSLTVPLGDAGDGSDDASGFANALLAAVGGPGISGAPVPTLLELSFDGGTTVDARWLVETVTPDLQAGQLVITCDGDDSGTLYSMVGPDRFPARDIALADVLGGGRGAITPLDANVYGISGSGSPGGLGAIPGLQGILKTIPGNEPNGAPMWDPTAQEHIAMTGVLSNALSSAIAFLGVNIDSWEDTTGRLITSLVKILGGVVFPTDTADQGSRGHAVWCDSDVNLARDIAGVVCDGSPSPGSPGGTNGFSNDGTHHPNGIPRALVIGNVGGNPHGHAFTFDGTATTALAPSAEATTARLYAEQTSMQPDLSPLFGEVRLTGGTSDAGLAPSERITSIITLNNTPVEGAPPYISWQNVLPFIGTNLGDATGGLYCGAGDGRLRGVPSWTLALPIYDMTVNNVDGVVYVATSQGIFSHATTNLATGTGAWSKVGGLSFPVHQMQGVSVAGIGFFLYALVSGVGAAQDGIYQYAVASPASLTTIGYDHWTRMVPQQGLVSMTATDGHSCFFLTTADQQANLHYYDATTPTAPKHTWSLGAGVQGVRLDRVISTSGQDSVWVATSGGSQPGKYLLYNGDGVHADWIHQSLQDIDADGSLAAAVGTATGIGVEPQINKARTLGYGINSVTVGVLLCTNVGIYYLPDAIPASGGANWSAQANGLNGLAGLSITDVVAGQPTQIPDPYDPAAFVAASRLYAISPTVFFYSYSDSRYWRDLLREPLTLGPFFYALAASVLGDLPSFGVQTIGPMASSPIGGPSLSHVQVVGCLPSGWYWRRCWNACYEPYYSLANSAVPYPQVYTEQITEVAVTPSVDMDTASTNLAAFFVVLLGEHSTKQTTLTVHAGFTQQESGLRYLWPTHQVAVSQSGIIKMLSSDGTTLVNTTYIDLVGTALYVLSHTISWDGPLVNTVTELGPTVRGTPQTGADLAAALVADLRRIRVHGLRTKR